MTALDRVITLEEHFATPDFRQGEGGAFTASFREHLAQRISDVERYRLPEMDAAGIDIQVLALPSPAVQAESDPQIAAEKAERANDVLFGVTRAYPDRFAMFAALPTQDPRAAADELRRAVGDLGARGAMINGHTGGRYLDDSAYEPMWAAFEELTTPLYLHPGFPPAVPPVLEGYPGLAGPAWGWAFETASHVLRLVASGTFDRHPGLTVLIGHMGEGIPFALDRLDDRWDILVHSEPLQRRPSDYIRDNVIVTTAGVESDPPLRCSIEAMGIDRVLFSVDYPYQSTESAMGFLRTARLTDEERAQVAGRNAAALLDL